MPILVCMVAYKDVFMWEPEPEPDGHQSNDIHTICESFLQSERCISQTVKDTADTVKQSLLEASQTI